MGSAGNCKSLCRKLLMKSCTQKSKNIKSKRRNSCLLKLHHYNNQQNNLTTCQSQTNSTMKTMTHTCFMTPKINNNLSTIMTTNINTQIKIWKTKEKCLSKIMFQSSPLLRRFLKILYLLTN